MTLRFDLSQTGEHFIILFSVLTLIVYAPGYYLHFGMLNRFGVPCFTKQLNTINKLIIKNEIKDDITDSEALELLQMLEYLPVHNMKAALIYPSIVLAAVVVQEALVGLYFNAVFLFIGIASAIFIYVFYTYISAELLTGRMRRKVKKHLVQKQIIFDETTYFSIRRKFIFINILILIAMFEVGLMFHYNPEKIISFLPALFVLVTGVLVALILFFYLISIELSLLEIESSALDLASGGIGGLYLSGMDKEIIRTGRGFLSAANEVNEIRKNLEQKVAERTNALNEALKSLEIKDAMIEKELHIAANIQKGILPNIPPVINSLRITPFHESMGYVGGDMYDIIDMEGGCTGILIADVSGHGVPAALVTTMAKICFIEASRTSLSPKRIFQHVNDALCKHVPTQEYLTAFFLVVSPTCDVIYGNASHYHALVLRKNSSGIEKWDTKGLFIGAVCNNEIGESYEEKYDRLNPGDRIILVTDGLIEERNTRKEDFGLERLEEIILTTRDMDGKTVSETIAGAWNAFRDGSEARDDVTFLIIDVDEKSYRSREYRERALDLIDKNDCVNALKELERALDINPDGYDNLLLQGKCYLLINDYNRAAESLKNYLLHHPGDAYALYLLSVTNFNSKEYDLAIKAAVKATQLKSGYVKAMDIIARSYDKTGEHEKAEDMRKRIAAKSPPVMQTLGQEK